MGILVFLHYIYENAGRFIIIRRGIVIGGPSKLGTNEIEDASLIPDLAKAPHKRMRSAKARDSGACCLK